MSDAGRPPILVCANHLGTVAELSRVLEASGHDVAGHLLGGPEPAVVPACPLVLIDGSGGKPAQEEALGLCRRLRARLEENFVPLLFLTDAPDAETRLASFEAGADTCLLRPFAPRELLAQVAALLRIKETHDRLAGRAAEVGRINKRLQQAYLQLDSELALAQRIQTSFLPHSLPQVPHVRFAVNYLLCGRVGGDFYDVFRLDEQHVGFYVADAMGHGVPASLLTIFVKKGVKAKEVFGQQYRLIPPDEVLGRLNRDLIEQQLSEQPFITMAYALFNHQDGTLQFARAGHPYPVYVPRCGDVELWRQEGLLLGVLEARFPCHGYRLSPGDKLLLYSDGIDSAVFEGLPAGADSLLACAVRHRDLPVQEFVARLTRDLFGASAPPDDLTLLGLEMCD
jgi:sigma-B regulation protein RsbU (phosphoserine phosphatase)